MHPPQRAAQSWNLPKPLQDVGFRIFRLCPLRALACHRRSKSFEPESGFERRWFRILALPIPRPQPCRFKAGFIGTLPHYMQRQGRSHLPASCEPAGRAEPYEKEGLGQRRQQHSCHLICKTASTALVRCGVPTLPLWIRGYM